METGMKLGLVFSLFGVLVGTYFAVSSVYSSLMYQNLSGHEAGIFFAIIGAIVGLSCALIGVVSNRYILSN